MKKRESKDVSVTADGYAISGNILEMLEQESEKTGLPLQHLFKKNLALGLVVGLLTQTKRKRITEKMAKELAMHVFNIAIEEAKLSEPSILRGGYGRH